MNQLRTNAKPDRENTQMSDRLYNVLYMNATSMIGGAETNLLSILGNLDRSRFRPQAVVCPREGPLLDEANRMGINGIAVSYHSLWSKTPYRYLSTMRGLARAVRSNETNIIHLNHHFLVDFAVAAAFVTRRPLVCHYRGIEGDWFLNPYRKWFNRASRIIAVSEAAAANLADHGIHHARITVVHDGIDVTKFRRSSSGSGVLRRAYNFSPEHFLIGYVGRPEPEKGLEDLLMAAREVCAVERKVRFAIVGEPMLPGRDYIGELQELAHRLELNGKVVFTGFRADIDAVYRDLDLMVLPSWRDAFPNVILEAMASRVPVIATAVGGIPEMVENGETGTLIQPRDREALSKAIISSVRMADPQRKRIISKAEERVRSCFTIERQVREIERVYTQVMGDTE